MTSDPNSDLVTQKIQVFSYSNTTMTQFQAGVFCFWIKGTFSVTISLIRKNYVRLQGGLLIMRNSIDALQWFATWAAWITRGSLNSKGILHQNAIQSKDLWKIAQINDIALVI